MATPYLVTCLVELRSEFNGINQKRDKGADGWIGDAAHQNEVSDHNPDSTGRVLALDIDSSGPWPVEFDTYVNNIVDRQNDGYDTRLEYVIWNRRIASRSNGWNWVKYTGSNDPHINHAHFSARHDHTGNTSGKTWAFIPEEDDDMPTVSEIWAAAFGPKTNRITAGQVIVNTKEDVEDILSDIAILKTDIAEIKAAVITTNPPEKASK